MTFWGHFPGQLNRCSVCLPPLCNEWCFKALRTEGSLLRWEGCVWANPHGPSLHFMPSFSASPPYTSIKWRMLMERWINRCRGPFNYACQKLIPSSCCPSSLICLPNLLVQPKQRAPVLFKYVGLIRSFQVFRLSLRHPTETITWTD